jgi:hypothetical protein
MFKCVLIALLAFAVPCSAAARTDDPDTSSRSVPRLRPNDRRSAALLLDGLARSTTMRMIVAKLEEANVIVYVETQPSLDRQLAGRLVWVTAVKNFRYVRVTLSQDLNAEAAISVLGHELQHALEVAQAPSIVDEASLEAYYRQNGLSMRTHTNGWDTLAARDTGEMVRREIANVPVQIARLNPPYDPNAWPTVYREARSRFGTR